MSRKFGISAAVLLALALTATSVLGAGAKFHSVSSSVNNSGALVVSFDERGLGNENIDYSLTADATALWACFNGGGKNPAATNKQDFAGQISAGASLEPKNGRVIASITAGVLGPGDFSCPQGQQLRLAAVTYSNILLCDTTNGTCVGVPNASRTFISL
jgi:hypothetical protein